MIFRPARFFAPDAGGSGGAGGEPKTEGGEPKPETKAYTQAELDAMFSERAKQAERSAVEKLLKKLGLTTAEELETVVSEGRKLKEGQMSELEKAQKALQDAQKQAQDAETQRDEALKTATERLLKAEVLAEASKRKFRAESLADVWLLVSTEFRSKITEKDGAFAGIAEAVEEVVKARAFWLETTETKRSPGTPRPSDTKKPKNDEDEKPRRPLKL